jgi:uncharacterized protein (DUF362 family)
MAEQEKSKVVLRGVTDATLAARVQECLERCEWEHLVGRDSTVVIKPNLCSAVPATWMMANTDVRITRAVCEVLSTRTRRIYIGESSGLRHRAQECFAISGYVEMAKEMGVDLVNFTEVPWTRVPCEPVGEIELPRLLMEADVFITLPVLKTHALTYFTGALKNQWGCLPQYDRILFHKHLDPMLVSLQALLKPKLTIMDGIIAMEGRGPTNGKPRRLDLILASQDPVAVDATAMRLTGLDPQRARHIVLAAEQRLGRMNAEEIEVDGDWEKHATKFEPAVLDKAIWAMNFMSRYRWFVKHILERDTVFYPVRALVQLMRKVGVVEGG